jgi:hypothetical protein
MADTATRVQVGVLLPRPPDDLGGWLADVAAYDAAGADALWLDVAADTGLDPLALAAALATLTYRSLLVTSLPYDDSGPRARARTLSTIARLSRGRLALSGGQAPPDVHVFRRVDGDAFVRDRLGGEPERWVRTPTPDSRAAWQAAVADAAERGVGGLLVPAGPRLLDILRNPDGFGDRNDLQLAVG